MKKHLLLVLLLPAFLSCSQDEDDTSTTCESDQSLDTSRGACTLDLSNTSMYQELVENGLRKINANAIPDHLIGNFSGGPGAQSPNAISEQDEYYEIDATPSEASSLTPLLNTTTGFEGGPKFSFGILFNGVEVDPVAAEPFPHEGAMTPNAVWEWNLEALNVRIGLDCNNAHVQPDGKYHYHGLPTLYVDEQGSGVNQMLHVGYAADGFPIYFKYGYADASDAQSDVVELQPSYRLKSGERPGDGSSAPCGTYNGVYSNDYEYVEGLGDLDEANGRYGITPEFPQGTYYYVLTTDFPSIPRYFKGTPSNFFAIGL